MRLPPSVRPYLYIGVPTAVVGFVAGTYTARLGRLSVKYEITAGEILNAFVTVLLALLVADYLSKKAATVRVEKDILIGDCADVMTALMAVRDFARNSRSVGTAEERRKVLSLIEAAFTALETLEVDLSLCKQSLGDVSVTPVVSAVIAYKSALTGGTFPLQPLDEAAYIRSEAKYAVCTKQLAALRFELNRR